jgi:hypothetical protein
VEARGDSVVDVSDMSSSVSVSASVKRGPMLERCSSLLYMLSLVRRDDVGGVDVAHVGVERCDEDGDDEAVRGRIATAMVGSSSCCSVAGAAALPWSMLLLPPVLREAGEAADVALRLSSLTSPLPLDASPGAVGARVRRWR